MPRSAGRLDQLIRAALRVFMEKGYRRTQMADVAKEMGVSPGTLYNYVEGKEALFHLLIDRAFVESPMAPPATLPIPAPPPGATIERLRERLDEAVVLPRLDAALGAPRGPDPRAELEGIVRELYALIAKMGPAITLLERSALDLPELAQLFFFDVRRGLLERIERYLRARARTGRLRAVPHPAPAARLLLEAIAWFAMHRHRDPAAATMGDETARETVVDFVVSALAPPDATPKARTAGRAVTRKRAR